MQADRERPKVVAILNVTPDSYYDGGSNVRAEALLKHAERALMHGADILEIGGESTGPDSVDVSLEEELHRVIPALSAIRSHFGVTSISVDTWKSAVASAALDAGACMINDITAGRGDASMLSVIAASDCQYVLMFSKDETPRTTKQMVSYDDVISTIHTFLQQRMDQAERAGIDRHRLIVDPGLGHFVSSDPRYSFEIIRRLRDFADLAPLFISPSRKSFLAGPKNLPARDRLPATLAVTALALENGARFIRTHDPQETRAVVDALFS